MESFIVSPKKNTNSFFKQNERQKLNLYLPVIEFLGTYPTEIKSCVLWKKAWELLCVAAVFIARTWEQPDAHQFK